MATATARKALPFRPASDPGHIPVTGHPIGPCRPYHHPAGLIWGPDKGSVQLRQWVNSRKLLATAIGLSLALAGTMAMRPATADTDPPAGTPATMTADALPTWQINGVVWSAV